MKVAETVIDVLARDGVTHLFGVPGGGSSLDLIDAASRKGLHFVLTRTETGAAFMAATMADLSGSIGVALATQGPGTASAVNGVAQAWLDKSPLVLFTDGWSGERARFDTHQRYDQPALLSGLVKGSSTLDGPDPAGEFAGLTATAKTAPMGPVYVELTGEVARRQADAAGPVPAIETEAAGECADALALLAGAKRPVIVAGLEARHPGVAAALQDLAEVLRCPVLTTYKAKGAIPSSHDLFVGLFTGGALEAPCVSEADLIVLVGFDPVELIGKPWPYAAPVLDVGSLAYDPHYVEPKAVCRGDLAAALGKLRGGAALSGWPAEDIAVHKAAMAARLADEVAGNSGLSPVDVVKTVQAASGAHRPRAAVDAGAHMFSAMAYWEVTAPNEIFISNGLATMGYSLPAAIAASLADPDRPVIAFTGDGGLLMCAGELATAADVGAWIVVVVFNDSGLSLIELKQRARQLPQGNLRWSGVDFAQMAAGAGVHGQRATTLEALSDAVAQAMTRRGPSLIDVPIDPSGYDQQSAALRG
ncbi:thiamine pyrophosphate-binding protein [Amorphus sp. 3PC139-8]|uniref:thiamine pyrophosphate-binding protein n=1 Tax=Amorphus sp. 3PC139-8 TaxID=2735676 RepID=UPI00345D150D